MVDLSLELLEGEFGPRDEDNTVQPYEVPQTMFPRTPDTRGDGPRPATQNITDTIIYDVSTYNRMYTPLIPWSTKCSQITVLLMYT